MNVNPQVFQNLLEPNVLWTNIRNQSCRTKSVNISVRTVSSPL
jgi:hypothetical protein